jgi:hypothetical protein
MAWRDDAEACAAILTLLRRARLEDLWTPTGPTKTAISLLECDGGYLSSGERQMLMVAFDFWNGTGKATIAGLLATLDGDHLSDIGSLLVELSNDSPDIDRWIQSLPEEESSHPNEGGACDTGRESDEEATGCSKNSDTDAGGGRAEGGSIDELHLDDRARAKDSVS